MAIWFLGQESVIVKGDGVTIYTDMYVSKFLDRNGPVRSYPAPISPEDITGADVCLITHEHNDYMDEGTLTVFNAQNSNALILAPACCRHDLLRMGLDSSSLLTADIAEPTEVLSKLHITVIPAAHETLEQDDKGNYRSVGYVLRLNGSPYTMLETR